MTPRVFTGLAVAALVSLISAVWLQSSHGSWSTGTTAGQPMLPNLGQSGGEITGIELKQSDKTLTLQKQDAGWTIKERDGFPAKTDKVRTVMVQLGSVELVERRTLNPARYNIIELEDPTGKDAKAREVRLIGKSDKPIADVIVGKKKYEAFGTGKNGVYIRRPGDPQTWLASGDVDAPLDVKEWVDRAVLDIPVANIAKVSVANAAGETLTFARTPATPPAAAKPAEPTPPSNPEIADATKPATPTPNMSVKPAEPATDLKDAPFAYLELPAGKKLKDGAAADTVPKSFAGLELDDVRKTSEPPAKDGVAAARIETLDGMTVNVTLRKEGADSWLSLNATGSDKSKDAAAALTKRAQGWEFKIPSWKADAIAKKKADFVDEKAEEPKPKP